jgi:hypothetical protein
MTALGARSPSRRAGRTAPTSNAEWARQWLLAALVALVVARPLLASEGVSWIGDGQPFNMLVMVITAGCFVLAIAEGGLARRMNLADVSVGALVALCAIAALVGAQSGSPRPAINMLFEWIAAAMIFFLARQLVRTPGETRALVAVMVALAIVMAGYGFYQVFIGQQAMRAAYAENPDEVLRAAGQWFAPGSPERRQFEDRLASSEPLATFALANSLAGFLAPWLVIGLAIALGRLGESAQPRATAGGRARSNRARLMRALGWAISIAMLAACLVLTKSRSAYVAVAAGIVLLPWFDHELRRHLFSRRFALAAAVTLLLVIGAAAALGKLDVEVLSEAGKSLGYRLEYWRATLAMIGRHPWLGVGPGNFQDYYTQFKLPQASEEIRDPHNFLLEIWATAGTLALLATCQLLFVFAWRTWNLKDPGSAISQVSQAPAAGESSRSATFMAAGGVMGFLLALVIGPSVGLVFSEYQLAGGVLLFAAAIALAWPWVIDGRLASRLPALGVLVLAVHLLAAGGIAFPGVAGTLWILLALGLNATDAPCGARPAQAPRRGAKWATMAGLVLTCAAGAACFYLAYAPVVRAHAAFVRAEEDGLTVDARINLLIDAAQADPLSAEPWSQIAELELARLKGNPHDPSTDARLIKATTKVLELRPHSSVAWRQVGRWFRECYLYTRHEKTAEAAAMALRRAVELYPNLAPLRGEYALALSAEGDRAGARRQAQIARRLDGLTAHVDKKLSPELSDELDQLDRQSDSAPR